MIHPKLDKIFDYFDVPLFHAIAIGITFTNIENILKLLSLALAIGYTVWKWVSEYKKKNEKLTNNKRTTNNKLFKKS